MTSPIDVSTKKIGELLGKYESRPVMLPEFQRSYSWDVKQVTAFWGDLLTFRDKYVVAPVTSSYFLGSAVILGAPAKIVLLDGQQRLATATIVFSAIRDIARGLDSGPPEHSGLLLARDIQRELIQKDDNAGVITYSLTLSDLDKDYFLKTIQLESPAVQLAKLRSHRLIASARDQSIARIQDAIKGLSTDLALKFLKSLQDALSKGMLLGQIQVQSEDDAFHIFETLNDRGLRLSVPDLVLNLLMSRAGSASARASVRDKWNVIVRALGKRDISRFLRHMWVSRHGDVKAQGLYTEIKSNLISNQVKSVDFSDECADECEIYISLLDGKLPSNAEASKNISGLLYYFDAQPAIPLLLSGYQSLNKSDFAKLTKIAITHYVRHSLVSNLNPLDLETAFYKAARTMREKKSAGLTSGKILSAAKGDLSVLMVDDASVEIAGAGLELDSSEALWLISQIASSMQSATKEVKVDKANLEHIFPRNPTVADWPNKAELEPFLWHIGNLMVLGDRLNQSAQNKSFAEKKSKHYSKSEIVMNKDLVANPNWTVWNEGNIKARAKMLAKKIVQTWRY